MGISRSAETIRFREYTSTFEWAQYYNMRHADLSGREGVGRLRAYEVDGSPVLLLDGVFASHGAAEYSIFYIYKGMLKAYHSRYGEGHICDMADTAMTHGAVIDGALIIFMKGEKPRRFVYDGGGEWVEAPLFHDFHPYVIERRDMGVESVALADVALGESYDSRSHELTPADAGAVGAALTAAYRRLVDGAAASHRYVQPVVARYRLIGHDGLTLYTSAPAMIAPDGGVQASVVSVALPAPDFNRASGVRLTATTFGLAVVATRGDDPLVERLVGEVRLEVSPQLHPFVAGAPAQWRYAGASQSSTLFTFYLPGRSPYVMPGAEGGVVRSRVLGVLAGLTAGVGLRPYADTVPLLDDDLHSLSALAVHLGASRQELASVGAPHTFSAGVSAVNGDTVAYGNLTVRPFDGYSLPEFGTGTAVVEGSLPTAVRVAMADGSSVVRAVTSGVGLAGLSPLLVYPSSSARRLTAITPAARATFELTPSPCGGWSFWLAPDCAPHTLPASTLGFAVPAASPALAEWPDAVALAPATDPMGLRVVVRSAAGPVTAITPALRSGASLEFAKARFYVMGPRGIGGLSPSTGLRSATTALIDPRGVGDHRAVVEMPGSVVAIAGGELVSIAGGRVTTLLRGVGSSRLGWSAPRRELWLSGDEGTYVYSPDHGDCYRRTDVTPSACVSLPDRLVIADAGGSLYDTSAETDAPLTIEIHAHAKLDVTSWRVMKLSVPLTGRSLNGTISLVAHHGDPSIASTTLLTLQVDGDLDHPVVEGVAVPHCHGLELVIILTTPIPSALHYEP